MSRNHVRVMSWASACSLIQAQEPLARRLQEAFRQGNTSEATALANELSFRLHNAIDECRLTPAASVAYHFVSKGSWIDMVGSANETANEVFFQFAKNPLNWKSHEHFSGYMKRALDWRSQDDVRFNFRHHDGRINGTNDDGADLYSGIPTPMVHDINSERACTQLEEEFMTFVAGLPEHNKLIATELYLNPNGMSQIELARHLGYSQAWVSEMAKTTRELIAGHFNGGDNLDQAA